MQLSRLLRRAGIGIVPRMTQPDVPAIFDPRLVRAHRDRAAAGLDRHDFLYREIADRLADRLLDVTRRFPLALDLGCHAGEFGQVAGDRGGIEFLVHCDPSPAMAHRAGSAVHKDVAGSAVHKDYAAGAAVAAEAAALPFAPGRFDLVVSNLSLHWVNDLPGALLQIRAALKPDGLFLAALPGGGTLGELRAVLTEAEVEITGGASPRIAPFIDPRDAGALLQRAGFGLPVVDTDTITVRYENAMRLMADLRGMGESNALAGMRRGFTRRDVLLRAAELYRSRYSGPDGRVTASFQIVYLTGWAPDPSQQVPLAPGSATARLGDLLNPDAFNEN